MSKLQPGGDRDNRFYPIRTMILPSNVTVLQTEEEAFTHAMRALEAVARVAEPAAA